MQVQSLTTLGRCHAKEGRKEEAAAAFEKAIREARRCRIKLFEFMALADCVSYGIGDCNSDSELREITNEVGIMQPIPTLESTFIETPVT